MMINFTAQPCNAKMSGRHLPVGVVTSHLLYGN